jgi:hypothetical protein
VRCVRRRSRHAMARPSSCASENRSKGLDKGIVGSTRHLFTRGRPLRRAMGLRFGHW